VYDSLRRRRYASRRPELEAVERLAEGLSRSKPFADKAQPFADTGQPCYYTAQTPKDAAAPSPFRPASPRGPVRHARCMARTRGCVHVVRGAWRPLLTTVSTQGALACWMLRGARALSDTRVRVVSPRAHPHADGSTRVCGVSAASDPCAVSGACRTRVRAVSDACRTRMRCMTRVGHVCVRFLTRAGHVCGV
jgi:hypothetical protein